MAEEKQIVKEIVLGLTADQLESLEMYRTMQFQVKEHPITKKGYNVPNYPDVEAMIQGQVDIFIDGCMGDYPPESAIPVLNQIAELRGSLRGVSTPTIVRRQLLSGGSVDGSSLDETPVETSTVAGIPISEEDRAKVSRAIVPKP